MASSRKLTSRISEINTDNFSERAVNTMNTLTDLDILTLEALVTGVVRERLDMVEGVRIADVKSLAQEYRRLMNRNFVRTVQLMEAVNDVIMPESYSLPYYKVAGECPVDHARIKDRKGYNFYHDIEVPLSRIPESVIAEFHAPYCEVHEVPTHSIISIVEWLSRDKETGVRRTRARSKTGRSRWTSLSSRLEGVGASHQDRDSLVRDNLGFWFEAVDQATLEEVCMRIQEEFSNGQGTIYLKDLNDEPGVKWKIKDNTSKGKWRGYKGHLLLESSFECEIQGQTMEAYQESKADRPDLWAPHLKAKDEVMGYKDRQLANASPEVRERIQKRARLFNDLFDWVALYDLTPGDTILEVPHLWDTLLRIERTYS